MSTDLDPPLEELLEFIQRSRGFDFTLYKRPSLSRRVTKRLDALGIGGFEAYRDYLELNPDEFERLFDTVRINVTRFYREPEAWAFFGDEVLAPRLAASDREAPVRAWSAGCSTGEEAYTLAMVLCDLLGEEAFTRRVKIYATDVDEDALAWARSGAYSPESVSENVPPAQVERYFRPSAAGLAFNPDLRRSIVFGRHDITRDAPISRLDALVCRNVLMYMISETQRRILTRFHYALREGGVLLLGRAETMLSHPELFTPLEPEHRLFRRGPGPRAPDRLMEAPTEGERRGRARLERLAYHELRVPALTLDLDGRLALANARARAMFGLAEVDIGRPFGDLEVSFRPAELRSRIDQAYSEGRTVTVGGVERRFPDGRVQSVEVHVAPLLDGGDRPAGVTIAFTDESELVRLRAELERSGQELQTANEELQSSNEELETTNEELQSSNEELETTNEELQSGNEELETLNEELHSTNAQLSAMNDELQRRTRELGRSNAFLGSVMASVGSAVVVIDDALGVEVWNARAEDLWGLRSDEVVGRSLMALDIGLPVAELGDLIRACLVGGRREAETTVTALTRRGRTVSCRVLVTPLVTNSDGHRGAVLVMEERDRDPAA